jgi:PGF-CTERM protein
MSNSELPNSAGRRAFLRATGGVALGAVGLVATETVAAQSGAPSRDEYETILDEMDGSGSEGDPYIVTNVVELQAVEGDVEAAFALGNDIDASQTSDWNDGEGFDPVGNWDATFTGSFDGRTYVITGLTVNRPDSDNAALFYQIGEESTLERVGLEDVDITGKREVGGVVGTNLGTVSQCFTTGSVSATGATVGGLVGGNNGLIEKSYSTATVAGESRAIGGLVGTNAAPGTVRQCYAAGSVDGTGAIVGSNSNSATVADSYWNSDTIEFAAAATPGDGRTAAEMKGERAGNAMTNLDFETTWRTVIDPEGFPQLQWVPTESEIPNRDDGDGTDSTTGGDDTNSADDSDTAGSTNDDSSDDTNSADDSEAPGGTNGDSSDDSGPGFGVGGALAGITSAGYLLKRRLREPDEE